MLVITSVFITLILVEIGLRISGKHIRIISILSYNPYTLKSYDKIIDWETLNQASPCTFMKPGSIVNGVRVNSHGFISDEAPYQKPDNEYRILLLGDSYATGTIPYKHHYLPQLENALNTVTQDSINVRTINLGIPCGGTTIYKKAMEVEGMLYRPDIIILSFFVGNDFIDDVNPAANDYEGLDERISQYMKLPPRFLYLTKLSSVVTNSMRLLSKTDFAYEAKNIADQELVDGNTADYPSQQYDPLKPNLTPQAFLQLEADHATIYHKHTDVYDYWPQIQQNISDIQEMTSQIGANLLVLIFPEQMQVDEKLFSDVISFMGHDADDYDPNLPFKKLIPYLQKNNIDYIDMLPELKHAATTSVVYQPRDTHLNSTGYALVTRVVLETLIQHESLGKYIPSSLLQKR